MTEADWLTGADPDGMLGYLRGKVSDRKFRLFACACCRRLIHIPWDGPSRTAVATAEQFADGLASKGKLAAAAKAVPNTVLDQLHASCGGVARIAASPESWGAARNTARNAAWVVSKAPGSPLWNAERQLQAALLREIVGNPFHPFPAPAMWPPKISILARAMYAGEDPGTDMGDLLARAGFELLGQHFRHEGHPKGCWALDLILGKS
jgi:hypothetical protein